MVILALAATLEVCQRPAVFTAVRLPRVEAAFTLPQDRILLPGIGTFAARESTLIGTAIAATVAAGMAILFTATTIPIGGGIHLLPMMETRIANEA